MFEFFDILYMIGGGIGALLAGFLGIKLKNGLGLAILKRINIILGRTRRFYFCPYCQVRIGQKDLMPGDFATKEMREKLEHERNNRGVQKHTEPKPNHAHTDGAGNGEGHETSRTTDARNKGGHDNVSPKPAKDHKPIKTTSAKNPGGRSSRGKSGGKNSKPTTQKTIN